MAWNRLLWGVKFVGITGKDAPMLLGAAWDSSVLSRAGYAGEPTRALLFTNRAACRAWCKARQTACSETGWKFVPVRVREVISDA